MRKAPKLAAVEGRLSDAYRLLSENSEFAIGTSGHDKEGPGQRSGNRVKSLNGGPDRSRFGAPVEEESSYWGAVPGARSEAPESAIVFRPIAAVMKRSSVTWMNASESNRNMPAP